MAPGEGRQPVEKALLVSIHDVTPARADGVRLALSMLEDVGVVRGALLVVPDFHARWPLERHRPFCRWLRERVGSGWEVVLHGYTHLETGAGGLDIARGGGGSSRPAEISRGDAVADLKARLLARWATDREGEFLRLDGEAAKAKLTRGREVLAEALAVEPEGFVAPAWLLGEAARQAVVAAGFSYTEDHLHLEDLERGRRHPSPVISWASRSWARRMGSLGWARMVTPMLERGALARVAVHPGDLGFARLVASIRWTLGRLLAAGFEPMGYSEFLSGGAREAGK